MSTLLLADIHCDRSKFLLGYQVEYFKKIIDLINEYKIKRIISLGDLTDKTTNISFDTLHHLKPLFHKLFESVDGVYMILGNHESYYKNTNDIFSAETLFGGISNITFIRDDVYYIKELNYVLSPWITTSNRSKLLKDIKRYNKSKNTLFGHVELKGYKTNDNYTMSKGQISSPYYDKYKMVYTGHFHKEQIKKNVHYVGSGLQTRHNEGSGHNTYMLHDDGKLVNVYTHEDIFIEIDLTEDLIDSKKWIKKIKKYNLNNKDVKLNIESDNNEVITEINDYIINNYNCSSFKCFFKNKEYVFEEIDVINKSNNDIENEFFNNLECDDVDKKNEAKDRFYKFKEIVQQQYSK